MTTRPRRTPVKRRTWPGWLALFLVVSLLGGGAYLLYGTSVLGVKDVQITGASPELLTQVQAAAAVDVGTPLIIVDTEAVEARVRELPSVASAAVSRKWPSAIVVTVTERVPVAYTQANDSWWLLDAKGTPYLSVDVLPVGLKPIELATPGPADPATLAALSVLTALPEALTARVKAVVASSPFQVTLTLVDGRSLIWGDASATAEKLAVVDAVLAQPGKVFDISDPTMVTVR